MADEGEREQVAVTFERRDYALTPSPGEVILPAHGRMIHHDPACLHLTDSQELGRFADAERVLWRRLIDSAPSDDTAGRAKFARSITCSSQGIRAFRPGGNAILDPEAREAPEFSASPG
ncbi:hypothetical protein [Streptomyces sp. NBC_00878]|uniref:hypothetical protein n=1 Tax=Streptomyces sp. NBC_00878 TaxID=2975854 RepID=UPI00225A68F4|nr:hypothetical protein [Streptomyces sp. NBC_00878]MCX4905037.1 hypothetical protein [Streptomyces sp. NBC_00878]